MKELWLKESGYTRVIELRLGLWVSPVFYMKPKQRSLKEADCWQYDRLACAAMIIDALGYDCTLEDLYDLYPQKSIWTIDLAYLLRNFVPKDLTFYTSYPGAHKEHRTAGFYRDQFEQDEKRVNHLFAHAEENGVDVVNMYVCITSCHADLDRHNNNQDLSPGRL